MAAFFQKSFAGLPGFVVSYPGGRGGGRGQAPDGPARPSHLLAYALDGKATLPQ